MGASRKLSLAKHARPRHSSCHWASELSVGEAWIALSQLVQSHSQLVTTSSIVPAALAKADISASAMDQDGNKAICVTAHLAREFSTEGDCSGSACEKVCECAFSSCSSQASACLADSACAAKQSCAFGCSCGDTVCIATCAAGDSL